MLIQKLVTKENLYLAWNRINQGSEESKGLDGVSIRTFREELKKNILTLQRQLKSNTFQFTPLKGCLIPKKNNKGKRALQIAAVRDRVVQRAILNVIEKHMEKMNQACSFGYRREISKEDAVHLMVKKRDQKYWYVLEADIVKFFDRVDRARLFEKIQDALPDLSINHLIQDSTQVLMGNPEAFSQEELAEHFTSEGRGIAQGSILSPVFANLYLASFDETMLDAGFKMVRYADDFVVLCKNQNDALKAYEKARKYLKEELQLDMHPLGACDEAKTRITHFGQGFNFLGYSFNHKTIVPTRESRLKVRQKVTEITKRAERGSLTQAAKELRQVLLGWGHTYAHCHAQNKRFQNKVMISIFKSVDDHVRKSFATLLYHHGFMPRGGQLQDGHWDAFALPSLVRMIRKEKPKMKTSQARVPLQF